MTDSPEARRENFDEALIGFLNALGSRSLRSFDINPSDYPGVWLTTWTELTTQGLLEDFNIQVDMYRLTGSGYLEALRVSGSSGEPQFQENLGSLCKVLKDSLKGRREFALISFQDVVARSRLSEAFVENAIDADLIGNILGRTGARWDGQCLVIRVPHDFGLPPHGSGLTSFLAGSLPYWSKLDGKRRKRGKRTLFETQRRGYWIGIPVTSTKWLRNSSQAGLSRASEDANRLGAAAAQTQN